MIPIERSFWRNMSPRSTVTLTLLALLVLLGLLDGDFVDAISLASFTWLTFDMGRDHGYDLGRDDGAILSGWERS